MQDQQRYVESQIESEGEWAINAPTAKKKILESEDEMYISDVDQYMFEVEKALRKYVKNPEHFTEIYNRCYEAVAKAIREVRIPESES